MAHLVQIGNSRGIRIPKSIIEQAQLDGKELKLQVVEEGLLIISSKHPRADWELTINSALAAYGEEPIDEDWLDASLTEDEEIEW